MVPTLINPRVPMTQAVYSPSWVEWSILAGCVSTFLLLYVGFTKLFPIVSVWEIEDGIQHGLAEGTARVRGYFPLELEAEAKAESGKLPLNNGSTKAASSHDDEEISS